MCFLSEANEMVLIRDGRVQNDLYLFNQLNDLDLDPHWEWAGLKPEVSGP